MDLKDILLEIFPSKEMAEYLSTQQLSAEKIADAVRGAPISLVRKRELLYALAESSKETLYTEQADEIDQALRDLEAKTGELFYVWNYWVDPETWETDPDGLGPYLTIERAFQGIREDEAFEEVSEDSLCWYAIEKWCPDGEGNLYTPITYFVVGDVICYFQKRRADTRICEPAYFESTNLNLPVPFRPGDIVKIDCRPFAPVAHAVIIEIGDNQGCCCLQSLFPYGESQWSVGAVKHGHVYPHGYPELSPLYRIARYQGPLSEAEQVLLQVSQYLQGDEKKGRALWEFVCKTAGCRRHFSATSVEILAYIEETDGPSTCQKSNI